MQRWILLACCVLLAAITIAQSSKEDLERGFKQMEQKGELRREGNRLIFLKQRPGDTALLRQFYEAIFQKTQSSYTIGFEVEQLKGTKETPARVELPLQNRSEPTPRTAADPLLPGSTGGCFSQMAVFGTLHFTQQSEDYTWTVPAGVTQIDIEAWSGGGHGDCKIIYTADNKGRPDAFIAAVVGGGGGGGAYAHSIIPVAYGDRILIHIPPGGGGKALSVSLNSNANIFYLNNGLDGTVTDRFQHVPLNGNGLGGTLGGSYGVFQHHLFWISGQMGKSAKVDSYEYDNGDAPNGGLEGHAPASYLVAPNLGDGGGAAHCNNGGRGARFSSANSNAMTYQKATAGGFPGGGGGGGTLPEERYLCERNLGAPGLVVIRY